MQLLAEPILIYGLDLNQVHGSILGLLKFVSRPYELYGQYETYTGLVLSLHISIGSDIFGPLVNLGILRTVDGL